MNKSKSKNKKKTKRVLGKKHKNTRRKIHGRKISISGGRLLGQGSYGVYYGIPPIPCIKGTSELDVDYDDNKYVTKIFENPKDADDEYDVMDRIEHSSLNSLDNLDDYFVLPIDRCNVDKDEINTNLAKYSDDWKKDNKHRYYLFKKQGRNPVLKANLGLPISDGNLWVKIQDDNIWQKAVPTSTGQIGRFYSTMVEQPNDDIIWSKIIIYPKAENDLNVEFHKIRGFYDFKSKTDFFAKVLTEMKNISDGIAILQQHNFIHGDIKDENCLVISEDVELYYKIGDVSFLAPIIGYEPYFPKWNYAYYYCWPFLSAYSYFFHHSFVGQIELSDPNFINDVIIKHQSDIDSNLTYTNKVIIELHTKINSLLPFMPDHFKHYLLYVIKVLEKIYGEKNRLREVIYDFKIHVEGGQPQSQLVQNALAYYKNWDIYFNSLDREHSKLDLYKRMDTYSFGFMIMKFTNMYLNSFLIHELTTLNPIIYVVKLFIVIDMCCVQVYDDETPRTPILFDFINEKFEEIVFGQELGLDLLKTLEKLHDETIYIRDVRPSPPPPQDTTIHSS